jgi:hypothetical protein
VRKRYWIAFLILSAAPFTAIAQQNSDDGRTNALSYVGTAPEELAQSVIIFLPTADVPMASGSADIYLKGRIAKVERGAAPGAIIRHADTFTTPLTAGEPVRLFLMKAPDRDAYYPIATHALKDDLAALAAVAALSQPTNAPEISVSITSPLGNPVNTAPLDGVPYAFGAEIRIPAGGPSLKADLYVGLTNLNGKYTFTWVSDAGVPAIRDRMTPLMRDIALGQQATIDVADVFGWDIEREFNGSEPPGIYLVFALLVVSGTTPSQPANWISVEMEPLFVQ